MNIKKQYESIYAFLEANQTKKVSTVLPTLIEMMESKGGGSDIGKTFLKDDEGNVIAVYCYYHKKWELIAKVEYGIKANTATGLNTMCKEGVSSWSKQQRTYKKHNDELLMQVAKGELSAEELQPLMQQADEVRKGVEVRSDEHGYNTMEELLANINS